MSINNLSEYHIKNSASYIIESLFIIMRDKPFASISIGEITKKACVHRTTFYRNFDNKEEIIKKFYECFVHSYLEALAISRPKNAQEYLKIFFSSCYEYKKELLLLYKNKLDHYFVEIAEAKYIKTYYADGMSVEQEMSICYHYGGLYSILHWWCEQGMSMSSEEIADYFYKMDGVKVRGGHYRHSWAFEE